MQQSCILLVIIYNYNYNSTCICNAHWNIHLSPTDTCEHHMMWKIRSIVWEVCQFRWTIYNTKLPLLDSDQSFTRHHALFTWPSFRQVPKIMVCSTVFCTILFVRSWRVISLVQLHSYHLLAFLLNLTIISQQVLEWWLQTLDSPLIACHSYHHHQQQQQQQQHINPYPTVFPYGNGMVLHFYQQQESSTTKAVHKVINKGLKAYV